MTNTNLSAQFLGEMLKQAAAPAKKGTPAAKRMERTDINKARLNQDLMRRMRMRSSVSVPLTGGDLLAVRKLAREALPLMRQRNAKLEEKELYNRLVNLVQSRRPEMREQLLAEIRTSYGS